jgi:hypothetical protein
MIRLFKRLNRNYRYGFDAPAPAAPSISREDVLVALHWGYTPDQWCALDNHVRTTKRSDYFQAAGFGA